MIAGVKTPLQKEEITSFLDEKSKSLLAEKIIIYDTIDSTNLEAKRIVNDDNDFKQGMLLLAEHQTAGKGRLGRSFYSPKSTGIYLSLVLSQSEYIKNSDDSIAITVAAAVAVRRALSTFGVNAKIKWVNDLFVNDKKVCGILTEGIFADSKIESYIIGIGINIIDSSEGFPEEIKNIAGSIKKDINRNELIASIINNLLSILEQKQGEIISEYRQNSFVLNKNVTVIKPNESYSAKVLEITDDAHLIVEKKDGSTEEILSGEISVKI